MQGFLKEGSCRLDDSASEKGPLNAVVEKFSPTNHPHTVAHDGVRIPMKQAVAQDHIQTSSEICIINGTLLL